MTTVFQKYPEESNVLKTAATQRTELFGRRGIPVSRLGGGGGTTTNVKQQTCSGQGTAALTTIPYIKCQHCQWIYNINWSASTQRSILEVNLSVSIKKIVFFLLKTNFGLRDFPQTCPKK